MNLGKARDHYFQAVALADKANFAKTALGREGQLDRAHASRRDSEDERITTAKAALGEMYLRGDGVEPNRVRALEYLNDAADQGNATAHFCLGVMYQLESNLALAAEHYERSAAQGSPQASPQAQFNLGALYFNNALGLGRGERMKGLEFMENIEKARHFLEQAKRWGHPRAQDSLEVLMDLLEEEGTGLPSDELEGAALEDGGDGASEGTNPDGKGAGKAGKKKKKKGTRKRK